MRNSYCTTQSERLDLYRTYAKKLVDVSHQYVDVLLQITTVACCSQDTRIAAFALRIGLQLLEKSSLGQDPMILTTKPVYI